MTTSQPFRKFKGKCLECGKRGHKAADCRSGERFQGNCHYCGKPGHHITECQKKKREEGSNNKSANTANKEVVLMTMDKLKDMKWCCKVKTWKHKQGNCRKINKANEQMQAKKTKEIALINMSETKFTKNTWIGDTGATSHITNSD